jgi:uncharacterized protein
LAQQAQAGKTQPSQLYHGGKDCTLFPVNRTTYDSTIQMRHEAIEEAKMDKKDKYNAIKQLEQHAKPQNSI